MMRLVNSRRLHRLVLVIVYALGILGFVASGVGGGGDDDDDDEDEVSFPTPTLPTNAVRLDGTNAQEIADEAVKLAVLLSRISGFKTGAPSLSPSPIKQVMEKTIEHVRQWGRETPSIAARTDDLSAIFCPGGGSAVADTSVSGSTVSGSIEFTDCNFTGILLNGSLFFAGTENSSTLDYSIRMGGTLVLSKGTSTVISFVMDCNSSGNESTGDFSYSTDYSLDGGPNGGYLVTTVQPVTGNTFSSVYFSGQLIVDGADSTRLRITVVPGNMADVELDDGLGGGFVLVPPAVILPI